MTSRCVTSGRFHFIINAAICCDFVSTYFNIYSPFSVLCPPAVRKYLPTYRERIRSFPDCRRLLSFDILVIRRLSVLFFSRSFSTRTTDRHCPCSQSYDTIRYDVRCTILTCARNPTSVSLIYRTETTTKKA